MSKFVQKPNPEARRTPPVPTVPRLESREPPQSAIWHEPTIDLPRPLTHQPPYLTRAKTQAKTNAAESTFSTFSPPVLSSYMTGDQTGGIFFQLKYKCMICNNEP